MAKDAFVMNITSDLTAEDEKYEGKPTSPDAPLTGTSHLVNELPASVASLGSIFVCGAKINTFVHIVSETCVTRY